MKQQFIPKTIQKRVLGEIQHVSMKPIAKPTFVKPGPYVSPALVILLSFGLGNSNENAETTFPSTPMHGHSTMEKDLEWLLADD